MISTILPENQISPGSMKYTFHKLALICLLVFTLVFGQEDNYRPKVGLVLSGGGAKGLAHIGALKVIKQSGIQIDYITGTSMGAFIGALYAIGYEPERLEQIFLEQNWDEFQDDRIYRENVSIEEKDEQGKYIGMFPIKKGKINLPIGLIAGQKYSNFISRLLWSVSHVEDFTSLPIPFKCIATDIVTGEDVVLDSGYLPDALRASMSLPTIFTPVVYEGKYLVDGGLVRNLPAQDLRDMGADIIIGVDVGAPLYTRDQLNSLIKIIDQAMSFQAVLSTKEQRDLCDILITPDIEGFYMSSFNEADVLIQRGETAALEKLNELENLARTQGGPDDTIRSIPLSAEEPLTIMEIGFTGLENVSESLILGKLQIEPGTTITPKELMQAVDLVYGSQYFERVTYKLEPVPGGVKLIIRVIETSTNHFKFGLNYDSNLKSAVLLNNTFRNIIGQGSKLSLDIKLGENPAADASYFIHTSWKPGIGMGISLSYLNFNPQIWNDQSHIPEASFEFTTISAEAVGQTIVSNSFTIGVGIQGQRTKLSPGQVPADWNSNQEKYGLFNVLGFLQLDTYNTSSYPTDGVSVRLETKRVTEQFIKSKKNQQPSYQTLLFRYNGARPVSKTVTITDRLYCGAVSGDEIRSEHLFYMGGQTEFELGFVKFHGLEFMEKTGRNIFVAGGGLQWEAWRNNYVILEVDAGNINGLNQQEDFGDLFDLKDLYYGFGLTFGYNSVIGPMEVSFSRGSEHGDIHSSIRIGYPF